MVIQFVNRCNDAFYYFIRNLFQLSLFYPDTKQTASRTDKKMTAISLLNSRYCTIDRLWHMLCCSSTNIIPGNCIFVT